MPVAIEPVAYVFRELWPQARVTHVLDDSLPGDLTAAGSITAAIVERFNTLARYCESCGADAVLFTCSAFGTAIDAAKHAVRVPVLKPNEAMLEEALAAGPDLALLATFEPSIPSLREGIRGAGFEPRHPAEAQDPDRPGGHRRAPEGPRHRA